mmetsp:Transcript_35423/g.67799  ORF Transcript_35423/g.67799 Transcript_35423/m.67799 type:complete len:225 (-) Transcript_35423:1215-1889(-)
MVEEQGRGVGAVHGQRQRPLPHGDIPVDADWHGRAVDADALHQHHRVPQLRGPAVFQEPGRGRVRQPLPRDKHPSRGVAVLLACEPARVCRHQVPLDGPRGQEQQRTPEQPGQLQPPHSVVCGVAPGRRRPPAQLRARLHRCGAGRQDPTHRGGVCGDAGEAQDQGRSARGHEGVERWEPFFPGAAAVGGAQDGQGEVRHHPGMLHGPCEAAGCAAGAVHALRL